jgi:hypothetical protein
VSRRLLDKITKAIHRDVENINRQAEKGTLAPESQEALAKYYKLLTDARLASKERELDEKLKRVEELARSSPQES